MEQSERLRENMRELLAQYEGADAPRPYDDAAARAAAAADDAAAARGDAALADDAFERLLMGDDPFAGGDDDADRPPPSRAGPKRRGAFEIVQRGAGVSLNVPSRL